MILVFRLRLVHYKYMDSLLFEQDVYLCIAQLERKSVKSVDGMSVVKVEMQMTSTGAADFSVGRGRVFKTLLLSQISPTSPLSDRDARQRLCQGEEWRQQAGVAFLQTNPTLVCMV